MLLGCFEPADRAKKTALGLKNQFSSTLHFGRILKTRDACCCQFYIDCCESGDPNDFKVTSA